MTSPGFVCPHDKEALKRLAGKDVVVRAAGLEDVSAAAGDVSACGAKLIGVIAVADRPLADCFRENFAADWRPWPVALFAPSMGSFAKIVRRLEDMRSLNLRVYLPADSADNIAALRILSSVGVPCCAMLPARGADWDALADLMVYAILGRSPRAAVDPFTYVAEHYSPTECLDWGRTAFDDPRQYLHVDAHGRVALSDRQLQDGQFIADDPLAIGDPAACPDYAQSLNAWRQLFLDTHLCSRCAGWRVCMGRFSQDAQPDGRPGGCEAFFSELMDTALQYQKQPRRQEQPKWQP